MDYALELVICAPCDQVQHDYADHSRWHEWQLGLVSIQPHTGELGQCGSTAFLHFEFPGYSTILLETIEAIVAGSRYDASYISGPTSHWCYNLFSPLAENRTLWRQEHRWAFDGADTDAEDLERFKATSEAAMHTYRRWIETDTSKS